LDQSIDCPDCGTSIPFETYKLLSGTAFECPGCGISIQIASASAASARDAFQQFEALKADMLKAEEDEA